MKTSSVRTLFLTENVPYPPTGGVPLRNWQNISIMKKFGPVAVYSVCDIASWLPQYESLPGVAAWSYYRYKNPDQLSAWEKLKRNVYGLRPYGHRRIDSMYTDITAREVDAVLAKFQPHLVVFEELWLYRYLSVVKRHECRLILDEHNVEAALYQNIYCSGGGLNSKIRSIIKLPQVKSIERDFIRQADQVWVCSDQDASLLEEWYGQVPNTHVIPNGVNVAYYDSLRLGQCSLPSGLEKVSETIIYIASFVYPPNVVAAELLIDQIYPRLREAYPNCRLILVGAKPSPNMQEAAKQNPRIMVTGKVEDVRPYLVAASVVVVPLLQGSGTRLKILEAFAAGLPVVSTAKGAEGLKARDGEHLLIRDSIEELTAAVSMLWAEPSLGQKLAGSAYELVQAEYSWQAVGRRMEKAVQELFSELTDTSLS